TLIKSSTSGALQFSIAQYKSGTLPNPTKDDLLAMARDFAKSKELGVPIDEFTEENHLIIAGLSLHKSGDFIRVWFTSDGTNIVLATYLHVIGQHFHELAECELIVR